MPPVAAGGDERATLAVTAALAETGARALVATDFGELAGNCRRSAASSSASGGDQNPLAMALNMRRLQHIIARSGSTSCTRARAGPPGRRSRPATRRNVRLSPASGDGGRSRPRTSFETAVAEGDYVIASSEFAAERAERLSYASHAPQGRPPGNGSLQASARTGERAPRVRRSLAGRRGARTRRADAGAARPGRGPHTLIEAAALIKGRWASTTSVSLAGDAVKPAFARELDALAVKCGVQSMLVRVGAAADPPAAFIGAAVVVFPATDADGVTRASIEAAAMGALTVLSDVGPAQ